MPNTNFIKRRTVSSPNTIAADSITDSTTSFKKTDYKNEITIRRNYWLHYLFSNAILIMAMLAIPFGIAWKKGFKVIVGTLFLLGILFLIGVLVAWVLDFIPLIANRPWINYFIDFVIQFSFWITIGLFAQKSKKKNQAI